MMILLWDINKSITPFILACTGAEKEELLIKCTAWWEFSISSTYGTVSFTY